LLRILIADDHDVIRSGLRHLLEAHPGWEVCGEAVTGREAVEMARELVPNIAILDLTMPELNGLEATRQIKKATPSTEVLIFTMHASERLMREGLMAGARGYLLKSDAARYVVLAVETLAARKPYFTTKVSETMLEAFLRGAKNTSDMTVADPLTSREREVVQLLAEGNSNKRVAARLEISVKTVETHRAAIMRKLGVKSIAEIVHYAVRNGMTMP
jgi:DNA-binding NarL/FixJ family response regulator